EVLNQPLNLLPRLPVALVDRLAHHQRVFSLNIVAGHRRQVSLKKIDHLDIQISIFGAHAIKERVGNLQRVRLMAARRCHNVQKLHNSLPPVIELAACKYRLRITSLADTIRLAKGNPAIVEKYEI